MKKHKLDDEGRLKMAMDLVRRLFRRGFSKEKIGLVLRFVDGYVKFDNSDFHFKFAEEIDKFAKTEPTMNTAELVITHRLKEARKKGLKEGREEGREEAIEQLLKNGFSVSQTASLLNVPEKRVQAVWEKIQRKKS